MIAEYLKTFFVGATLCMVGQVLIDKTRLTPARILTLYVVAGVLLGAVGVYEPFARWAGAGASVEVCWRAACARPSPSAAYSARLQAASRPALPESAQPFSLVFSWPCASNPKTSNKKRTDPDGSVLFLM